MGIVNVALLQMKATRYGAVFALNQSGTTSMYRVTNVVRH